ncbi:dihydropyrimidinase [[Clostridium] saccharolyticum WM1]|uniref:Dihydropyrimidinase n=2 Tax=Lacrimispora TaxID=2719231 RepID=D9R6Z8_LACSW|nr:dihydropyrimidinase [[Clostridium] saccharolyticum WM1]
MFMKTLLKGGTVVSGSGLNQADVLMDEGKIQAVEPGIQAEGAKVIDVTGKLLFPGFIDAHTHFDLHVAGTVTADNFETGTKAALSGGTTMIIDFATQYQGETLEKALENWHKKADGNASCDYGFHLAISDWNPSISKELEEIVENGVTSFKLYMTYDEMYLNDKKIYQVLKRLKEVGGIAGVHCENMGIIQALVEEEKAKGNLSISAHKKTRPAPVEAEAIGRLLKIAGLAEAPVIIVHLSSGEGYQEVKYARERGQEIYVETCPQYLLLDESVYELPGFESSKYVISPTIKKEKDSIRLWNALLKNHIQTLATDHCSFTTAQKAAGKEDFTKIPNGMPGVESRPVLLYSFGVLEHNLKLEQMCRLLSENPAKLYGVYPQKGAIAPGSDGDLVVWNPNVQWTMSVENQVANVDYCPFEGTDVKGKAELVFLKGRLAAKDGQVVLEKSGSYVPRKRRMELY